MALRDVIAGPWENLGELACLALDLQLKLYDERRQDAEQHARAQHSGNAIGSSGDSLFEAAASKIVTSIGDGDSNADIEADIKAVTSLPPAVLARAFGETWERIPYVTLSGLLMKLKNDVNAPSNLESRGLLDIDVDEWCATDWPVRARLLAHVFRRFCLRILKNERLLRDDRTRDWRYPEVPLIPSAAND